MKFISILSTSLLVAGAAASASDSVLGRDAHGLQHPGDAARAVGRRGVQNRVLAAKRHGHKGKKCASKKGKQHSANGNNDKKSNASSVEHKQQKSSKTHSNKAKQNGNSSGHSHKSNSSGGSHNHSGSGGGSSTDGGKGLFGMTFSDSQCSNPDASNDHPNGSPQFLTCGISKHNTNSKWNPADVKLSQVKMISADQAAQSDVFKPCAKYKSTFEQVAKANNIPAVLLMSFALQESTCNAGLTGDNGEIGISQITPDKCGGAPGGNCHDVYFNLDTAAKYFTGVLNGQCNGNALCAIGQYNGWQMNKMTYASATNQQYGCMAQVS